MNKAEFFAIIAKYEKKYNAKHTKQYQHDLHKTYYFIGTELIGQSVGRHYYSSKA